jgi:hypothetical protein
MKFARPREAESFPDPRVHESILLRQASVRSKMRRVAAAKPHAQHVSLSGEHRMLKSSSARFRRRGRPGQERPLWPPHGSADRPSELHALLHRLHPIVHIYDWKNLKYVEGGELAGAVQQLCRVVGLHYGEPALAVEPVLRLLVDMGYTDRET